MEIENVSHHKQQFYSSLPFSHVSSYTTNDQQESTSRHWNLNVHLIWFTLSISKGLIVVDWRRDFVVRHPSAHSSFYLCCQFDFPLSLAGIRGGIACRPHRAGHSSGRARTMLGANSLWGGQRSRAQVRHVTSSRSHVTRSAAGDWLSAGCHTLPGPAV